MRRALFAAMILAAACKKHEGPAGEGSGSGSGSGSAVAPVDAAPAAPVPLAADALDKAIAAAHATPDSIVQRATSPTVAWALIATRDAQKQTTAYDLLRVRAADSATLHIAPPAGTAHFDDAGAKLATAAFGATAIVEWNREVKVTDPCDGCFRTTDEDGTQLYAVSGTTPQPSVGATFLIAYSANSQSFPEGNTQGAPEPDDIAYDWKASATSIHVTRTKDTVAPTRLPGVLDPAKDPLLAAGAGKDIVLGAAPAAAPAGGAVDDKALDAALAARGAKPDKVKQRKVGAHSAWALVEAPRNGDNEVTAYDLVRVTSAGAASVSLAAPAKATWQDTAALDVRDLDGNGSDECLVILTWGRAIDAATSEAGQQLFVVGGSTLGVAATAVVDYTSTSEPQDGSAKTEHVAFDWKADGKTLTLTPTATKLNPKRPAGLVDPKTFAAGSLPIAL
ncbi:MAG TPA: hypothetical protein VGM88_20290 [Kofleriaceae bacterium]